MPTSEGEHTELRHQTGVVGATGFVGGAVVRALRKLGEDPVSLVPRASVQDGVGSSGPKSALNDSSAKHIFRRLELHDERTFEPAMTGLKRLFLMRPPAIGNVEHLMFPLIDMAVSTGVERIVFLSVSGAETRAYLPHAKIEARLTELARRDTLKVAILRPGFFAQNLLSAYREDIRLDDRLYVCAAGGKVAFVDTDDIGAIGARALMDGGLDGRAATLSGPTALSFDDVAELLAKALNRSIVYTPASIPGFFCHRVFHRGANLMEAAIITALHAGLRRGDAEPITHEVHALLGRPATPMAEFIARHLDAWRT